MIFSYNLHSWTIIGSGEQTQRPKPKNDGQKSYKELKKIINSSKKFIYQKSFEIAKKWFVPNGFAELQVLPAQNMGSKRKYCMVWAPSDMAVQILGWEP